MDRRTFITSLAASTACVVAAPSIGAEDWVNQLNAQYNAITTAFAPFVQTNPNGSKANGRWFLSKPGKMRFEYDDPNQPMMIADGGVIAIYDKKSNSGPKKYPQVDSPLSLLAKQNIDLAGTKYVRELKKDGSTALVTMSDPDRPQFGQLILRINLDNGTVKGWQAVDKAGNRTTVDLTDFRTGVAMNPDLFVIR